jgi:hypothetical protein
MVQHINYRQLLACCVICDRQTGGSLCAIKETCYIGINSMNDLIKIGVEMYQTPLSYDTVIVMIAHIYTAETLSLFYT